MYETTPSVLYFSCLANYSVLVLGPLIMLPVLWVQSPSVSRLLEDLKVEQSLSNAVTKRQMLHLVFCLLFALLDFIMNIILHVLWNESVIVMHYENIVFTASVIYSTLSIPSIHTFPLILMIITIHVLHVALEDTNEELQRHFVALLFDSSKTPSENISRDKAHTLCALRARYVYIRRLHQNMADIFVAPLLLWTLNRIFTMILIIFSFIAFVRVEWMRFALVVECLLSLFLLGSLTDGITVQVREPVTVVRKMCVHNIMNNLLLFQHNIPYSQ